MKKKKGKERERERERERSMGCRDGGGDGGKRSWAVLASALALGAAGISALLLSRSLPFSPHSRSRTRAVGIIPARYQSSRFEGKPLALILGKPMIQVTILFMNLYFPSVSRFFRSAYTFPLLQNGSIISMRSADPCM